MGSKELEKLYKRVDECKFCETQKNELQHIHGYGAMKPGLMLILVNPTHRNISSEPNYQGPRFPFIGVRQFWRVLADGGLIDKKVLHGLPLRSEWNAKHTKQIQEELETRKLFLTNVVKCCASHSNYPSAAHIKEQLKVLAQEIGLVRPKRIVAFGALVFEALTGQKIKLGEHLKNGKESSGIEQISGLRVPVMPCYFPVGRGNPQKAIEILKKS